MSHTKTIFLAAALFILPLFGWADTYPVNKNIDIQHYAFEISLSDSTDEISGKAQITVLFKTAGLQSFRLDLINKSAEKLGNGMVVEAVMMGNEPVHYTHQNDEIVIHPANPPAVNASMVFTIIYHGIPFDGLRIGPTKFGDRSFFCESKI